jgi:hypothetical protein
MKLKKYLKIAGGVLFGLFALSCALRIPIALARLHQAGDQNLEHAYGYLYGTCAGILVWGGLSFYLFWSASKTKDKS